MKRVLFPIIGIVAALFVMTIGGVDNVARGQSLAAPTNVSSANGTNLGEVDVSWRAVPAAGFYRIGWIAQDDYNAALAQQPWPYPEFWLESFHFVDIQNRGQTSLTVTRLTPGIHYAFIVASNDNRYGEPSWATAWAPWLMLTPAPTQGGTGITQPPGGGTTCPACPVCPAASENICPISPSTFKSSTAEFQAVDAGKNHTCGIKMDNTIECWGENTHGQANAPAGQFLAVSAGGVYSCGIDFDNQLKCWGHAAIPSPPVGDYTHVSVGDEHACAITVATKDERQRDANRIRCWGLPNNDGRSANQQSDLNEPFQAVVAGSDYSCALSDEYYAMQCWGNNQGHYDRFRDERNLVEISAGDLHICARYANSGVLCHGNDVHKQTSGIPNSQDEGAADDFYTYNSISAGGRHTCGVRTTGQIRCWGDDLHGQATPPGANNELLAGNVEVGDFTEVSAGEGHTCGLRRNDKVVCWGLDEDGQATPP